MGLNGAGKTSLLRILAGETRADAGTFRLGHGVQLGYYAQEHEGIHDGMTVLTHMHQASPADDQSLRSLLGMFGLPGERAFQDAGTLSGGEKTKLALAQLVAGRKNLLLLDEPTNNLDPPSRTAIAQALRDWPGAMVIVSHDTEFVEALAPERVLLMPDGASTTGARISSTSSRSRDRYAPPMSAADLAFVNGSVYTVDAARTRASAVGGPGRPDRGRRHATTTSAIGSARRRRWSTSTDGCCCPGSRTRTSTR